MIEDRALLEYMRGLAVGLDPVERFRMTVGEPDPWQVELLRTDPRLNVGQPAYMGEDGILVPARPDDRMVLALSGRQSGKSTACGCLAYSDFARARR